MTTDLTHLSMQALAVKLKSRSVTPVDIVDTCLERIASLDPKLHDRAIAALRAFRAIRRLHTVSGDFDLLLELTAATAEELDDVLTRIGHVAGVKQTKTSVLLSTRLDRD